SILCLHQKLIRLRKSRRSLALGAYRPIVCRDDVMLYVRESEGERLLIALNLGGDAVAAATGPGPGGRILLSTYGDREGEMVRGQLDLRPDEGAIVEVD